LVPGLGPLETVEEEEWEWDDVEIGGGGRLVKTGRGWKGFI